MIPFMYPVQARAFPILIIENQNHLEDEEEEEEFLPSPTEIFSRMVPFPMASLANMDESTASSISDDHPNSFCIRMNVDDFQPNELHISIRRDRLIVRGKHLIQAQTQSSTSNSTINSNDDTEADFVSKEFKRTFIIPANADVRKALAQFYSQQQLLVIEIPFENSIDSSQTRINRARTRSIDVFLAIITILLMDRAVRITYEQFLINEHRNRDHFFQ